MIEELNPFVEYASDIVSMSILREYDTGTTLNGLAVATAAMLIDTTLVDGNKVDEENLHVKTENFVEGLKKAINFAKANLDAYGEPAV